MGVALAVSSVCGCKEFDASLLPPVSNEPGCAQGSIEAPSRPAESTEGPDGRQIVFALKDVDLKTPGDGLNVDGMCTGATGPWGCLSPDQLAVYEDGGVPTVPTDYAGGVDDQFSSAIYPLLSLQMPDMQATSRIAEGKGIGDPVVLIDHYNGTGNDPHVTVTVTQSVFGVRSSGDTAPDLCVPAFPGDVPHEKNATGGCSPPGPAIPPLDVQSSGSGLDLKVTSYDPGWSAGDIWFWGRDDTYAVGVPRVKDTDAYVRDYQIVVHLPDGVTFNLVGEGQAVQATLTGALAVGKLEHDLSGSEPNGVTVAGRWAVVDLLSTAGSVGICPNTTPTLYATAQGTLAAAADVRRMEGSESMTAECDALSIGITFTAYEAHFAGTCPGQPIPTPCSEDGGVPDGGVPDGG